MFLDTELVIETNTLAIDVGKSYIVPDFPAEPQWVFLEIPVQGPVFSSITILTLDGEPVSFFLDDIRFSAQVARETLSLRSIPFIHSFAIY